MSLQASEPEAPDRRQQLRNEETMRDDAKVDALDDAVRELIERFNSTDMTLDEFMDEMEQYED